MQYLGAVVIFICALGAGFLQGASVSAGTLSASGDIKITAIVAPAHYVVVDEQDNILEITSNTTEQVTPRIFRLSITTSSEIALSQEITANYKKLVPQQGKIGVLFKKQPVTVSKDQGSYLLPLRNNTLSLLSYFR